MKHTRLQQGNLYEAWLSGHEKRITRAGGTTVYAYVECECACVRESKALSDTGSRNKP